MNSSTKEPLIGKIDVVFASSKRVDTEYKRYPWSWKKFWQFTGPGQLFAVHDVLGFKCYILLRGGIVYSNPIFTHACNLARCSLHARALTLTGWLMSLAYLDPGNLEADLQQGAYTNYKLVWVLFAATAIGLVLQELSSRLGVVTGEDLAVNSKTYFTKSQSRFLYVMMEIAIIGSDIQEVLGSAIAIKLLSNNKIDLVWGCLITGLDTFTFLFVHKCGARYLEALICALIFTMAACFFINWGEVDVDGAELAQGWFIPYVQSYAIMQAVGTIGAVIMPHNLYLHSGLVQSREVPKEDVGLVKDANRYFFWEATLALTFSYFINLALVSTFAEYFFDEHCASDNYACMPDSAFSDSGDMHDPCGDGFHCGEIGLDTAGPALQHNLGDFGQTMWGLGLLAAGQASTMTATLAGQIVMGGFLDWKISMWLRVAITR
jgi:natural resistance-associated macrophage protein